MRSRGIFHEGLPAVAVGHDQVIEVSEERQRQAAPAPLTLLIDQYSCEDQRITSSLITPNGKPAAPDHFPIGHKKTHPRHTVGDGFSGSKTYVVCDRSTRPTFQRPSPMRVATTSGAEKRSHRYTWRGSITGRSQGSQATPRCYLSHHSAHANADERRGGSQSYSLSCGRGEAAPAHPCARSICASCAAGWGGGSFSCASCAAALRETRPPDLASHSQCDIECPGDVGLRRHDECHAYRMRWFSAATSPLSSCG
jgi:hypothetical protein